MPPVSHATLRNVSFGAALIGQWTLGSSPQLGVMICGVSLVASLLDGWWYLQPLGKTWWYPALFGLIGLTMWDEPRGWFFFAWAAVDIGTGLRARSIFRRWQREREAALAEERERAQRLAALGYEVASAAEATGDDEAGEQAGEVVEAAPVPPPIAAWRYPLAIVFGLVAAWLGAWGTRIFGVITGWQLDLLALGIGYLVGKAIIIGAGDRSSKGLQFVSAALSVVGVLYGRYLLLSYLVFDKRGLEPEPLLLLAAMVADPGKLLGIWMVLFVAVGAWNGWHYARDPWLERRR